MKPRPSQIALLVVLAAWIYTVTLLVHKLDSNVSSSRRLEDDSGIPELKQTVQALRNQVRMLESKQNAFLSFDSDPFLSTQLSTRCKHDTRLSEYCDHKCTCNKVCLDDFPYKDCIIYDFGVRTQPEFGAILSQEPFHCQVFAFDPSPVTQNFYQNNPEARVLKENPNYHLYSYGGGGQDETIKLREYNWGQVSIFSYPDKVVNPHNCSGTQCEMRNFGKSKEFPLPVRSVDSIMKELGHEHITILKIDTEGSEYRMLETLILSGACQHIDQLSLEWHHFDFDGRYGHGASPHLNVLIKLLKEECGLHQYWIHSPGGWPSRDKLYADMNVNIRYNLAAFKRKSE